MEKDANATGAQKRPITLIAVSFLTGAVLTCVVGWLFLFSGIGKPKSDARLMMIGKKAPEISGTTLEGTRFSLKSALGKVVFIDFWGRWCRPCVRELPYLREVWNEFGERDDFVMIGLSRDPDRFRLRAFLLENDVDWAQILLSSDLDRLKIEESYNVRSLPSNFLIDHRGHVQFAQLGGNNVRKAVELLLLENTPLPDREASAKLARLRVWKSIIDMFHQGSLSSQWISDLEEICQQYPDTVEAAEAHLSIARSAKFKGSVTHYEAILRKNIHLPSHIAIESYGAVLSEMLSREKKDEARAIWHSARSEYAGEAWVRQLENDLPDLRELKIDSDSR